ncbi:hypothetical protein [Pseudobutyrivibrio xylanivorans]|uniref:Uncharacterized protein n=1 Tax=Pseudobutyrivibrio xylanivorans DSM 14809 TaxID=1123012 RepID=A0A1M6KP59_PSEXY|nr:hypothetical protein [Pseudobutyrivibrio xylanivorans]SHJ60710.1 hypothetical protein SAMN02745725_02911 [Pseudobutyrivibrio xylanivorans DSM 14809]
MKELKELIALINLGLEDELAIKNVCDSINCIINQRIIEENVELIADIFGALLVQVQKLYQNDCVPEETYNEIFKFFRNIENISTIANDYEKKNGYVILIDFMRFLHRHNAVDGDNDFTDITDVEDILSDIIEELEKVSFIFDYAINKEYVFPINRMLVFVIKDSKYIHQGSKFTSKDYYALKLAVRFFKKETEDIKLLEDIINESNLQFINYLNDKCLLLDDESMINYQNNGVMIFWNSDDKKVLIRSNYEDYFSKSIDGTMYEVQKETTIDKSVCIGCYVEFDCDKDDMLVSALDLLKFPNRRKDVLQLFCSGYKNIFVDNMIVESKDGKLRPLNPFIEKDGFVIKNSRSYSINDSMHIFSDVSNLSLFISKCNPLNRVCIGTFVKLYSINSNKWDKLLDEAYSEDDFYQNQMIYRWIDNMDDKAFYAQEIAKNLCLELQYCKPKKFVRNGKDDDLKKYNIKSQSFYPFAGDLQELLKYIDDSFDNENITVNEAYVVDDDGVALQILGEKEIVIVENDHIIDSDELLDDYIDKKCYVVRKGDDAYVLEQLMLKVFFELNRIWKGLANFSLVKKVSKVQYDRIVKCMYLHQRALTEKIIEVYPLDDTFEEQAFYRLLHNMIYYGVTENSFDNYARSILGHFFMSFSDIKKDRYFLFEDKNTLYVPKDSYDSDGVLSDVHEKYLKSSSTRDFMNLFNERLEIGKDGKYALCGNEIKHIVFLYDNFELGKATKDSIDSYMDISGHVSAKKKMSANSYRCLINGETKFVSIKNVYETNGCDIAVHAYYGTEEASKAVDEFLDNNYIRHKKTTYYKIITTKIRDLKEYVNGIWDYPEKNEDKFAVIREFNLTYINVFPEEMILNPQKAITLFVRKGDRNIRHTNVSVLGEKVERVIDTNYTETLRSIYAGENIVFEADEDFKSFIKGKTLEEKLEKLNKNYNERYFESLISASNKGILNENNKGVVSAVEQFAEQAFCDYFEKFGVSTTTKNDSTALYLLGTLKLSTRIVIWKKVLLFNKSYYVIDKLSIAYAKSGQIDQANAMIEERLQKGDLTEEEGAILKDSVLQLYNARNSLPIAEDDEAVRSNYKTALKVVDKEHDVRKEFLCIIEMLVG